MSKKDNKSKLKIFFLKNPTRRLRVREIERTTGIPLPSVIRYTKELCKEDILEEENISNIVIYKGRLRSERYKLEKKLHNIRKITESGLIQHIKFEYNNPTIILFGSYAKGEDIENSDIDIYIETTKKVILLEKFEKKLEHKLQLFVHKNIKEIKNKELANNIINGITLNGFLEIL